MTKEAARDLIKTHWISTGNIQNMNDEEFEYFSECFPTVDIRSGFKIYSPIQSITLYVRQLRLT